MQGITIFCFAASYAAAMGLEVVQLLRPAKVLRWGMYVAAAAGLLAHTLYLVQNGFELSDRPASLLFLSWILAIFYLYGSIHHRQLAWGVFVLPVVLGLVLVAWLAPDRVGVTTGQEALHESELFWGWLHAALLILGAVGICVSFVASAMYLVQAQKLKHKVPPGEGLRLLSLERLEEMNRRAINLAFPLLTAGLLIGAVLWKNKELPWQDPIVLSTGILWLVFAVLLYLRYGLHLRGRRVAFLSIAAFGFLVIAFLIRFILPSSHPSGGADVKLESRLQPAKAGTPTWQSGGAL